MKVIKIEVPESQVVEWVMQLSPEAKQEVLRTLIPRLDYLESLVNYGSQRARALSTERGWNWDSMTDEERQRLIGEFLHEE